MLFGLIEQLQAESESEAAPPKKKVKTEHVPIVDLTAEKVKQESQTEERRSKLKSDPVLREIYNEIVGNGILSEEEFWQSRAVRLLPYIGIRRVYLF